MKPRIYARRLADKIHIRCEKAPGVHWSLHNTTNTLSEEDYFRMRESVYRYIDFIEEWTVRR